MNRLMKNSPNRGKKIIYILDHFNLSFFSQSEGVSQYVSISNWFKQLAAFGHDVKTFVVLAWL